METDGKYVRHKWVKEYAILSGVMHDVLLISFPIIL